MVGIKDERRRLLAVGCSAFLFRYSANIFYLTLLTLFLKRVGADHLSYQYLVANGIVIGVQVYLMRKQGWSNFRLLRGAVTLYCAISLLFAAFSWLALDPALLFLGLVAATVFETVILTTLTEAINALFSVRDFKRIGPCIFGVGTLGNIAAGLTLKLLGDLAGVQAIFVAGGASCLLLAGSVWYLGKRYPHLNAAVQRPEDLPTLGATLEAFPLGKAVILLGFLTYFARFLLDYEFSALLATFANTEGQLVAFFGMFSSFLELTLALVQLTLVNRVFNAFKIGRTLCVAPSLMLLFSPIILVYPSIYLVFLFQFAFNLMFRSFYGTGITYLLNPIPSTHRKQLRVASSFGMTSGILACGLFLMLCKSVLSTAFVMASLAPLALLIVYLILQLDRGYLQILLATPDQARKPGESVPTLQFISAGAQVRALPALLRHPDEQIRVQALSMLGGLPEEQRIRLLVIWLLSEKSAGAIRAAVRTLHQKAPADFRKALARLLGVEPAPANARAIANLVEALGELPELGYLNALVMPFLESLQLRLRCAAVLCLIPAASDPVVVERAADTLLGLLSSEDALSRSSAAVVMGKLKRGVFVPALNHLLSDEGRAVVKNAIVALGLINSPQAFAALDRFAQCTADPEYQVYARRVYRHLHRTVLRRLSSLSEGVSREERLALGALFEDLSSIEQLDLLARLMMLPDSRTRLALAHLVKQYPDADTRATIDAVLRSGQADLRPAFRRIVDNAFIASRPTLELLRMFLDDANQRHLSDFIEELSDELWVYTLIAHRAGAGEPLAARQCRRAQVRLVSLIFQLSLALAGQSAQGVRSIRPLLSRDPASRARALEVFDAIIPSRTNRRLIPLLEHLISPGEEPPAPPGHLAEHAETMRRSTMSQLLNERGQHRLRAAGVSPNVAL